MKKKSTIIVSTLLIFTMLLAGCGKNSNSKDSNVKDYTAADCIKLGNYVGIEVDTSVTDEEVQKVLDNLKTSNPDYNKITDRKAKTKDLVNIDFSGKIDGKVVDSASGDKQDLTLGSGQFISGFEDGVVGMKPGEKKVLNLTFPTDYSQKDLQGKKVDFTVKLNYIKEAKEVKVTDAWIKKVTKNNGNYKTIDEYNKGTKESLVEKKKENAGNTAFTTLCKNTTVTKYPDSLLKKYKQDIKSQFELQLKMYGMTMEQYYTQAKTTEAKFNEELDKAAKEQTLRQLVTETLSAKEKITVSVEDKKKEIKSLITSYNAKDETELRKTFKETYKTDLDEYVNDTIMTEKISALLKSKAKII